MFSKYYVWALAVFFLFLIFIALYSKEQIL